jgi:hypothetical protein
MGENGKAIAEKHRGAVERLMRLLTDYIRPEKNL